MLFWSIKAITIHNTFKKCEYSNMSVSNKLVVTYGSEMTLQKTDENSLSVYQRKALRKILGPCKYGKIGTEIVIS